MNAMRNSQRGRPRLLSRSSQSSGAVASTSSGRPTTSGRPIYPATRENPTILVHIAKSQNDSDPAVGEPPRRRGGGRGREWMGRCHRLIQAMLELEESKPFRDPVNELLFPDYSSCVEKHMDLSRVMMNLHSGLYMSPAAFDADIKLIFSNWKKYNKDPSSTIYSQLYKLSWWYNREFTSLMAEVAEKFSNRSPNAPTKRVNSVISNAAQKTQLRKILPASRSPLAKRKRLDNNELNNSATSLSAENVSIATPPASRFAWTTLSATTPSSVTTAQESAFATKSASSPSLSAPVASTSSSKSSAPSSTQPVLVIQSPQAVASNSDDGLSMELDVTNIWLGSTRVRPSQPVKLSEEGFQIYLAPNSDFSCTTLAIPMKDIVRAVGHLSKSKKHSLFVFVTPSVEKEMRSLYKGNPANVAKSKIECFSLVTIFVKALSSSQISRLIHIFWNMSRNSIFGQLFSETDQMGALSILASIKPNIMHRVAEKHNENSTTDSAPANRGVESNPSGRSTQSPRAANRAASTGSSSGGLSKQLASRLANVNSPGPSSSSNSPSSSNGVQQNASRGGGNADDLSNRESPTDVISSSSGEAHEDVNSRNGLAVVDDGDLEIVDPSESVEDAAMEAMLADEDDLVMMKTVINTKCPITQLMMTEPVKNKNCGHTYDKQGVQQLIVNRGKKAKCPVPGCSNDTPLEMVDMERDTEVEQEMQKTK